MSMIGVDYGVLNQRGSPSWFSDVYANLPTAGYKGRMFISTDTFAFYRDTGTGWDLIGGPGTGTITGSGTSGQVSYFNGSSTLAGSNNLFWDNTNGRLGIGTATPGVSLDIHATGTNAQFNGTGTNNAYLVFQNAGASKWRIGNTYNAGANSFDIYNNGLTNTPFSISSTTNAITLASNVTTTGAQFVQNALYVGYANGGATALYTNMYGSTNGINFGLANGTGGANFIFQTANGYNYTFPASTGTIALTSNLSSYLPLAGGTLTGALGGTSAIFSSNVAANCTPYSTAQYGLEVNGGLLVKNTGLASSLVVINADPNAGGNDGFVQVKAGGTFTAAFSTIQTYYGASNVSGSLQLQPLGGNVLIGTTTNATFNLDVNGTGRFVGALRLDATANIIRSGNDLRFNRSDNAIYTSLNDNGSGATNGFILNNTNSEGFHFKNGATTIMRMSSSSNVLIGSTTDSGGKLQVTGTTLSTGFQSIKGSVTLTAGATATIYTMPSDGIYYVYCRLNGGSSIYQANAIVSSLASNSESFISITRSGANVALSTLTTAIRITSGAFSTQTWQYSILFQPVD